MGKYISKTIIITLILCSVCFLTYNFYNAINVEEISTNKIKQNNNMLSMMIESNAESGQYEMTTSSRWPTDGYVFNSELSKCENGGNLSWDDTNKKVVFEGNNIDKCYVYFDVYNPPKNLNDVCNGGEVLSSCIISLVNKNTSDITNIYYHSTTLENSAEDNSYRYSGALADVKNYICLGSNEETCPDDNLYRIIGLFGENNHGVAGQQLVKVIKNGSLVSTAWNSTTSKNWANASLNTTLNTSFLTEKLSGVEDKIVEVAWKVTGYNTNDTTAKTFYKSEIASTTTVNAKIGLMYASDYGFAITPDYWTTNLSSYSTEVINKDWLYLGADEWTISPLSNGTRYAWYVDSDGNVQKGMGGTVTISHAVRPSFYLTADVAYVSGTGTSIDPIRVK